MTGLGFFTIFQAALNYLVDTFQKYAASAVAANSEFPSGFPKDSSKSNARQHFSAVALRVLSRSSWALYITMWEYLGERASLRFSRWR